uniref:CUB domain-containing protein n=1 Tax=Heterorhabditis bacteriophora TaxID=37862 RepID=A0A1I7XUZ6_HETBA
MMAVVSGEKWSLYNEDTNITCIIVEADVTATVKFTVDNITETYTVTINKTNTVDGSCGDVSKGVAVQKLEVHFFPNGMDVPATSAQDWTLELIFTSDESKAAFQLTDYSLITSPIQGTNFTQKKFVKLPSSSVDFQAHGINAFKCSTTSLPLTDDSVVELRNLQAIAFANLETPDFSPNQVFEQCFLDARTSDIVPIVVGACLAGLRQGYASV